MMLFQLQVIDETARPPSWGGPKKIRDVVRRLQFAQDGQQLVAWVGDEWRERRRYGSTEQLVWIDPSSGEVVRTTGPLNEIGARVDSWHDPPVTPDLQMAAVLPNADWGVRLLLVDYTRETDPIRRLNFGDYDYVAGYTFNPSGHYLYAVVGRHKGLGDPSDCRVVRCEVKRLYRKPPLPPRQIPNQFRPGTFLTVNPSTDPWKVVADIPNASAYVTAQAISSDGQLLASGLDNGDVYAFALPSGRDVTHLPWTGKKASDRLVARIAILPNETQVAMIGAGEVVCHPLRGAGKKWRAKGIGYSHDIAFTPNGSFLLVTDRDGFVHKLDATTGKAQASYNWKLGPLYGLAVSPDGLLAAAGGEKGEVVLWDLDP